MTPPPKDTLMVDDLLKLAARVEQATGIEASSFFWNLEREIKAALEGREYISFEDDLANRRGAAPPKYCTSLDAAMSLVPEGWKFGCGSKDATCRAWAWVGAGADPLDRAEHIASGATPALALTAAALRSIASLRSEGEK